MDCNVNGRYFLHKHIVDIVLNEAEEKTWPRGRYRQPLTPFGPVWTQVYRHFHPCGNDDTNCIHSGP